MQNKYLKFLLIALLVVFIVPQIALASWYNPFSWNWNNVWNYFFQKSQTSTVQQQTNTAGWKTYTNTQYGFSVGYPPEATLKDFSGGGYNIFLNKEDMSGQVISINISKIDETHICSQIPIDPMNPWKKTANVNIGGIAFDHYNNYYNNSNSDSYDAVINGECWQIGSDSSIQIVNSVLNTFKFTNPTVTNPASSNGTTLLASPTSGVAPLEVKFSGSVDSKISSSGPIVLDYGELINSFGTKNNFCAVGLTGKQGSDLFTINPEYYLYKYPGTYIAELRLGENCSGNAVCCTPGSVVSTITIIVK